MIARFFEGSVKKIFPILLLCIFVCADSRGFAAREYTVEVKLAVDGILPETSSNYDGTWHNEDWTIDLTAADAQSGIKETYYRINNGQILSVGRAGQPFISVEGSGNELEYWSMDNAGNEEFPHNLLRKIKLDKTLPAVEITSPADETAVSSDRITIFGMATDALSGVKEITINAGAGDYNVTADTDGRFSVDNVKISGGPNNIRARAADNADNTAESSISVFLGWVMHLEVPYEQVTDFYSGAACSQMILNYIRSGVGSPLTQGEIYNYGRRYNDPKNSGFLDMDAQGMRYALGHFDPYDLSDPGGAGDANRGYNFGIEVFAGDKFDDYLRDIIHWIAYPVTVGYWRQSQELAVHPNTPAAAPAYGTYNHWIIVTGASTSVDPIPYPRTNPWWTPDFTVYGLWLSDPAAEGIGRDLYVTPQTIQETYLFPIASSDTYNGKYLQVAEPPAVESSAKIELAEPDANEETRAVLKISKELSREIPDSLSVFQKRIESAKRHIYDAALVVDIDGDVEAARSSRKDKPRMDSLFSADSRSRLELDWSRIVGPSLLTDKGFIKAFDGSQARSFVSVRRSDKENEFYYLIPFDKYVGGQFLTYAAVIIDAQDGSFQQASWVEEPARFIQIPKDKAIKLILSENPALQNIGLDAELIWQPAGISASPFYPYWRAAAADGKIYFVTQKGEVIKENENPKS